MLGIKYAGGVALASDTLGSYGSLAKSRDVRRIVAVGDATLVGGSGDIADFYAIKEGLEELETENEEWCDDHVIDPKSVHTFLTRWLYNRRTKMNPLWNTVVVAGFAGGEGYLGLCDKIGVAYTDPTVATGYGAHIALPLMRKAVEENPALTEAEAVALLKRCLKVLYYRDARSLNRFQIATASAAGVHIGEPETQVTDWGIASMVRGYE